MTSDQLRELGSNEILRKRLAKWMAQFCFRNTKLEDLHDRISDDEMKELMTDCVNHSYAFLSLLFSTRGGDDLIELLKLRDQVPEWNEPEIPTELIEAAKHAKEILKHLNRETA